MKEWAIKFLQGFKDIRTVFRHSWTEIEKDVFDTAVSKGHCIAGDYPTHGESCMGLALMHSEISECIEALREGNPICEKCPPYSSEEVELADLVIRVMVYARRRGYDIPGAILAKKEFNRGRPFLHGKKF